MGRKGVSCATNAAATCEGHEAAYCDDVSIRKAEYKSAFNSAKKESPRCHNVEFSATTCADRKDTISGGASVSDPALRGSGLLQPTFHRGRHDLCGRSRDARLCNAFGGDTRDRPAVSYRDRSCAHPRPV